MTTFTLAALLLMQTLTATMAPNTPFQVSWDYPAATGFSFRLWCNGSIVRNFTSADLTVGPLNAETRLATYTATVPGLPIGTHTCQIGAYTDGRPDAKSEAVSLLIPDPTAPIPIPVNVRIIVEIKK